MKKRREREWGREKRNSGCVKEIEKEREKEKVEVCVCVREREGGVKREI